MFENIFYLEMHNITEYCPDFGTTIEILWAYDNDDNDGQVFVNRKLSYNAF